MFHLLRQFLFLDNDQPAPTQQTWRVGSLGCLHVKSDVDNGESSTLGPLDARNDADPFDLLLRLGDWSSSESAHPITDTTDTAVVLQEANSFANDSEDVNGNHDAMGQTNGALTGFDWFTESIKLSQSTTNGKYIKTLDPTADYPHERFKIEFGNVQFLMLGDRNDIAEPFGRGTLGGYPDGAMTEETYTWLNGEIAGSANPIVFGHHVPPSTVFASGSGEDTGFHGPSGNDDWGGAMSSIVTLAANRFTVSSAETPANRLTTTMNTPIAWVGSHTHNTITNTINGRGWFETINGFAVMRTGFMSNWHNQAARDNTPWFLVWEFVAGSTTVTIRPFNRLTGAEITAEVKTLTLNQAFVPPTFTPQADNSILETDFSNWVTWDQYGAFTVNPNSMTVVDPSQNTAWNELKTVSPVQCEGTTAAVKYTFTYNNGQPTVVGLSGTKREARIHSNGSVQIFTTSPYVSEESTGSAGHASGDILRIVANDTNTRFQKWNDTTLVWDTYHTSPLVLGSKMRPVVLTRRNSASSSTATVAGYRFANYEWSDRNPV